MKNEAYVFMSCFLLLAGPSGAAGRQPAKTRPHLQAGLDARLDMSGPSGQLHRLQRRNGMAIGAAQVSGLPEPEDKPGEGARKHDAEWGWSFRIPPGWTANRASRAWLCTSSDGRGLMLVLPHSTSDLKGLDRRLRQGMLESRYAGLRIVGAPVPFGENAMAAEFSGTVDGIRARVFAIGMLPAIGEAGAVVLVVTKAAKFSLHHRQAAVAVARDFRFLPTAPDTSEGQRLGQ